LPKHDRARDGHFRGWDTQRDLFYQIFMPPRFYTTKTHSVP
jgi:hypothetical protein